MKRVDLPYKSQLLYIFLFICSCGPSKEFQDRKSDRLVPTNSAKESDIYFERSIYQTYSHKRLLIKENIVPADASDPLFIDFDKRIWKLQKGEKFLF